MDLSLVVNLYDAVELPHPSTTPIQQSLSVAKALLSLANVLNVTTVPGAKPLAWLRVLTPASMTMWMKHLHQQTSRAMSHVWLLDDDMEFHNFDLAGFLQIATANGASIMQPRVQPKIPGHRSTDHEELRYSERAGYGRVSFTCFIETQTPFFKITAWALAVHPMLAKLPTTSLAKSTGGISHFWCGIVQADERVSLLSVTPTLQSNLHTCAAINLPIVHDDARTIDVRGGMVRSSSPEGLRFRNEIRNILSPVPVCQHGQPSGHEGPTLSSQAAMKELGRQWQADKRVREREAAEAAGAIRRPQQRLRRQ